MAEIAPVWFVRIAVFVTITVAGSLTADRAFSWFNSVWFTSNIAGFTVLCPILKRKGKKDIRKLHIKKKVKTKIGTELNLYRWYISSLESLESWVKFSADDIFFLVFPRKLDLAFHAYCLRRLLRHRAG